MEQLKHMKETLIGCVQGEICNLKEADVQELGAAVDMIKDLSEAIYYCTITEAMEEKEEKEGKTTEHHYYTMPMRYDYQPVDYNMRYYPPMDYNMRYYDPYRDMDRDSGKMYYNGGGSSGGNSGGNSSSGGGNSGGSSGGGNRGGGSSGGNSGGGSRQYSEREYPYPLELRDRREGRSPMSRKMYMEAKEMQHGKEAQMKELENYMQELTSDVTEMIKGASPDEKQLLQKKISALAAKIEQVNV